MLRIALSLIYNADITLLASLVAITHSCANLCVHIELDLQVSDNCEH